VRISLRTTGICLAAALAATAANGLPDTPASALLEHARALHREVPLIDGHNDYPWTLREKVPSLDLAQLDIRVSQPGIMTDVARLRAGGVGGQFWSVYVPASLRGQAAIRATLEQIDIVHRLVARDSDVFAEARTADDVERAFKAGRIASLIGMEGGHSIDDSLGVLRTMYDLGARYMTLTHSENLAWADSATDEPEHDGLTKFGEAVVGEMNRLGMLVDLSHVSPATMADALRVTKAPVIFSHSSARALCDVPRNVPDDILRLVKANHGVVMVNFYTAFVAPEGASYYNDRMAEQQRLRGLFTDPAKVRDELEAYGKTHKAPPATLEMVADHVDHIRQVAGIDSIGIGSDFDGIDSAPKGLEDVSKYPALTAELLRRGYSDDDAKKILGLNVLRVMREAERVAARLQREEPPSTATLASLDGTR
jgi:membrane dipeptidase